MKTSMVAVAALLALAGVARADDISTLQQQTKQLREQNRALAKKLNAIEKRQRKQEARDARGARKDVARADLPTTKGPYLKDPLDTLVGEGPLTWHGITIYGTIDGGLSYLAHGNPPNPYAGWSNSLITKGSGNPRVTTAPNGMSFSTLGVKGDIDLMPGWAAVFNVATSFNPFSGQLVDGLGSMVKNNGVPLQNWSTNGDSSRAGQALETLYYAGIKSKTFGQLTFGRQNSLLLDQIAGYDPTGGALDFSPFGFSGVPGGGGDTQNARLDNTIKYMLAYGPVHGAVLYKFGSNGPTDAHDGWQANIGFEYAGFALDATYSRINGAISAGPLAVGYAPFFTSVYGSVQSTFGTLAGVASDNRSFMVSARYTWDKLKLFAGYENINYGNPSNPIGAGYTDLGGYVLSSVNNAAFPNNKILEIMWAGAKYAFLPNFDVSLGYWHYNQHAFYATYPINKANPALNNGCSGTAAAPTCAGTLDAISLSGDYHFTKRFDVYAGAMYSHVSNGLASGYLHTFNINPTIGARYSF